MPPSITHSSLPFYCIDCESRIPNKSNSLLQRNHITISNISDTGPGLQHLQCCITFIFCCFIDESESFIFRLEIYTVLYQLLTTERRQWMFYCAGFFFFKWPETLRTLFVNVCSNIRTQKKLLLWWKNHSFVLKSISVGIELSIFLGINFLANIQ